MHSVFSSHGNHGDYLAVNLYTCVGVHTYSILCKIVITKSVYNGIVCIQWHFVVVSGRLYGTVNKMQWPWRTCSDVYKWLHCMTVDLLSCVDHISNITISNSVTQYSFYETVNKVQVLGGMCFDAYKWLHVMWTKAPNFSHISSTTIS